MLNKWDGTEILVWNPYSLTHLLGVGGYDVYLHCIENQNANCRAPYLKDFEEQGVELMQVISRCRANFQQLQWDQGARVLGLFSVAEWEAGIHTVEIDPSLANVKLRLRLVELRTILDARQDPDVVQCFVDAYALGVRSPNCMRAAIGRELGESTATSPVELYFEYEMARGVEFKDIDACRSFSGGPEVHGVNSNAFSATGASMPLFLWTGSSHNKDHVATPHLLQVRALCALTLALRAPCAPRRCARPVRPTLRAPCAP